MAEEHKSHNTLNAPSEAAHKAALVPAAAGEPAPGVPKTPDPRWGVERCCVREFWAVIERDASLVRGRNVLRTAKLGTGIYEVFFTGEVSNGAFVATIGRPGIATEPPGEITEPCAAARAQIHGPHSLITRACGYRPSIPTAVPATARST